MCSASGRMGRESACGVQQLLQYLVNLGASGGAARRSAADLCAPFPGNGPLHCQITQPQPVAAYAESRSCASPDTVFSSVSSQTTCVSLASNMPCNRFNGVVIFLLPQILSLTPHQYDDLSSPAPLRLRPPPPPPLPPHLSFHKWGNNLFPQPHASYIALLRIRQSSTVLPRSWTVTRNRGVPYWRSKTSLISRPNIPERHCNTSPR